MKLVFDSSLQYQQDAIKSITDLFKGQPIDDSFMEFTMQEGMFDFANGVGNKLVLNVNFGLNEK